MYHFRKLLHFIYIFFYYNSLKNSWKIHIHRSTLVSNLSYRVWPRPTIEMCSMFTMFMESKFQISTQYLLADSPMRKTVASLERKTTPLGWNKCRRVSCIPVDFTPAGGKMVHKWRPGQGTTVILIQAVPLLPWTAPALQPLWSSVPFPMLLLKSKFPVSPPLQDSYDCYPTGW